MHKYQIDLTQKKMMVVSAKSKREARLKAKDKLGTAKKYFKIEYVTENDYGFFF